MGKRESGEALCLAAPVVGHSDGHVLCGACDWLGRRGLQSSPITGEWMVSCEAGGMAVHARIKASCVCRRAPCVCVLSLCFVIFMCGHKGP